MNCQQPIATIYIVITIEFLKQTPLYYISLRNSTTCRAEWSLFAACGFVFAAKCQDISGFSISCNDQTGKIKPLRHFGSFFFSVKTYKVKRTMRRHLGLALFEILIELFGN